MSEDPFKEASKYNTAVRNVDRWVARRTAAIKEEAARKYHELRAALSPAAARIVVAAESDEAPRLGDGTLVCEANDVGKYIDPNPTPAWLNESPPPVPPGGVIEVADKPKARRA